MSRPLLIGMVVGFAVAVAVMSWLSAAKQPSTPVEADAGRTNRAFALGTLPVGIAPGPTILDGGTTP